MNELIEKIKLSAFSDIENASSNKELFDVKVKYLGKSGEVTGLLKGMKDLKPEEYGWGYGENVKSEEEFAKRYEGLTSVLLENKRICGFCYTQLTDIEQEQNGLYKYDRTKKFSDEVYERIRKANTAKAEIEK